MRLTKFPRRHHPRGAGQAIIMMVFVVGFFAILGGTFYELADLYQFHLFLERVATAAARAASTQVTETADGHAVLDGGRAQALGNTIISQWASIDALSGSVNVTSGGTLVVVDVRASYNPLFVNLITVGHGIPISAEGRYSAVPVG